MTESYIAAKIPVHLYQIAIGGALKKLPPLERTAVTLRFLRDRSIAQVATLMGMSWDGANTLIDRGFSTVNRYLRGSTFAFIESTVGIPKRSADSSLAEIDSRNTFENFNLQSGGK